MDLVISGDNVVVDFDLLIATQPMPKQPQIPARKITAMIYPAAQKPETAIQIKSIHPRAANCLGDLALQFGCDAFVRIDDQHPIMFPANIFQSPILLPWEFSIPNELHDSGRSCLSNRLGVIRTRRI